MSNSNRNTVLSFVLAVVLAIAGFAAGRRSVDAQQVASDARDAEYVRVVGTIADHYGYDPSEVEMDCGLVDAQGNIKR